jgi:hypothetical protein
MLKIGFNNFKRYANHAIKLIDVSGDKGSDQAASRALKVEEVRYSIQRWTFTGLHGVTSQKM